MPHRSSKPLGDLERAVMEQLWALPVGNELTVREVHEALANRELAYTTVMTVLDRLAKKQLVTRVRDGRAWRYQAAASREQLTAETLRTSLAPLDAGDRQTVLMHFLQDASDADLAALRAGLAEVELRRS